MSVFACKNFSVQQSKDVFKITTDTFLLARLIEEANYEDILEVGSGTGFISLVLADRFQGATIDAIDIAEPAYQLSRQNFLNSSFASRMQAIHASFESYNPQKKYDLIVCNPPYFKDGTKAKNNQIHLARHQDSFDVKAFFAFCKQNLKPNGKLYTISPAKQADQFIEAGLDTLFIHKEILIYDRLAQTEPVLKVHSWTKDPAVRNKLTQSFYLKNENGLYTIAYAKLADEYIQIPAHLLSK